MIFSFFFGALQLHLPERRFAAHQGKKIYCWFFRFVSSLNANEVICGKFVLKFQFGPRPSFSRSA